MTSKVIVITSVFHPTEAVKQFAGMDEYRLIVVGDKKTPPDWKCDQAVFLPLENQHAVSAALNKELPLNHYCRKLIGYVDAIRRGAEVIIDTDDDNIPKPTWGFPILQGDFDYVPDGLGYINIYQAYSSQPIWPRGLPLNLITKQFAFDQLSRKPACKIGIWQGLADADPDVDAIYRLTSDTPCYFHTRAPIVLGKQTISPFNSQNTLFVKRLFPLLYLPSHVTFRFTDILRGLIAQPIMWLLDYHLGFTNATVVQKRNPHDYLKDFASEIPMYVLGDQVVDIVNGAISSAADISGNLFNAYDALEKKNVVPSRELAVLSAWLKEVGG